LSEDKWLSNLWKERNVLSQIPVLLLWGLKDKAFPEPFLVNWKIAFHENTVVRFEYSGHNSPEEIGEEAIPFVKKFVDKN
jgi:pimeloyl-ACP methyl ester carboxylesterase